jgi:hypothetical protein
MPTVVAADPPRRQNPAMSGRYREHVYTSDCWPRWVAIFDLQWKVIETQRLEPDADLSAAMRASIERLSAEGWEIEAPPKFGFSFIRRDGVRRLLMLTPRDPFDTRPQSFNPFK